MMPDIQLVLVGLSGLVWGSFLNVVIHRLPLMLERDWQATSPVPLDTDEALPPFNLLWPGSHCPACHRTLSPLENIPLLSYLMLRGRCAGCDTRISWRYPLVEGLTALLCLLVYLRFGWNAETLAASILTCGLIALSFIDIKHQLLPDAITLPLIWLGLILSLLPVFADSHASILGAVAGYVSLWLVYQVFRLATGKEGMGFGDFKLLSLLGAWLGWESLPQIILVSSLTGLMTGVLLIVLKRHRPESPLPFGPFLALAGWLTLLSPCTVAQGGLLTECLDQGFGHFLEKPTKGHGHQSVGKLELDIERRFAFIAMHGIESPDGLEAFERPLDQIHPNFPAFLHGIVGGERELDAALGQGQRSPER